MNAVLLNGEQSRIKYDIERKANELAKHRLVHVMFDCNRLYWKDEKPAV